VIRRAVELGWPTVLVACACAGLGSANWARPAPELLAACLVGAAVAGSCLGGGTARLVCLGLVLALAGLWWGGLRLAAADVSLLRDHLGESQPARVVVTGPARRTPYAIRLPAEVRRFGDLDLRERVLLELPPERAPPQGAVLELSVQPVEPRGPETGFDERGWLARRGVHVVLRGRDPLVVGRRGGIGGGADRLRAHVAAALARAGPGERAAILAGVVLGADEGLDRRLQDDFRAAGLYHLLAVSGQNVAFVVIGTVGICWLLGLGRLVGEAAAIVAVVAYVLAVGWQPSVVRAGVAGILASLAWLVSRPRDRWHFMALGALVLLVWTPASLLEPGFQLSFAAVAAILLSVGRLRELHAGYPIPRRVVELVGIAAACGAATAPILLVQFGSVPLWTVPANALAEPAMPLLLGLGLLAAAIDPLSPSAATALAWLAGWPAAWLALCARLFARLPYAETGSPLALVGAVAVVAVPSLLVRARRMGRRSLAGAAALLVAVVLLLVAWKLPDAPRWTPPNGLRVTFLDVGQGDAALLEVPEGAVLVDQGPPEADVAGQLRAAGVSRLAALVMTHPQQDHVGGAEDVIRELDVDSVLEPGLEVDNPADDAALSVARTTDVPVLTARAGQRFRLGALRLHVLWPDGPGGAGEDPNENAIVVLASYGAVDILLTADAESNVTARLSLRPVEVLKVAHHGSEDPGLPGLLDVLRPRVAVISAGRDNSYGHPRPETLAALGAFPGLRLYRTDRDGAVVVESDGRSLRVRSEHGVGSDG
jgi:competence protein ComEC